MFESVGEECLNHWESWSQEIFFSFPQKSTLWSQSGLNIDIDNLMGSTKSKAAATTSAPSMNQLASGGGGGPSKQSTAGTAFMGTPSPAAPVSGPNYNISTSMMMSSQGAAPTGMGMQPGGMRMQPGGMGMAQPGFGGAGMGMNYGGGVPGGMGYGGMGMRPGFMGGFGGQPMMGGGYGGAAPMNPMGMGMQQQQRPF